MDLAKIRQKARTVPSERPPIDSPPPAQVRATDTVPQTETRAEPRPATADVALESGVFDACPAPAVTQPPEPPQPARRTGPFDPIEAILAGRVAAGCCDDAELPSEEQTEADISDFEEFLCFRVSDEIYGINIMQIKEIIKPREVTEVPRSPSFVSGVISLRGVIIPILDMLDRLGLVRGAATGKERVVVVKYGEAYSGLLVDEVTQVVRIAKNSFEPAPAVLESINRDFVAGIGRSEGRMIILLNLNTIADINLY